MHNLEQAHEAMTRLTNHYEACLNGQLTTLRWMALTAPILGFWGTAVGVYRFVWAITYPGLICDTSLFSDPLWATFNTTYLGLIVALLCTVGLGVVGSAIKSRVFQVRLAINEVTGMLADREQLPPNAERPE